MFGFFKKKQLISADQVTKVVINPVDYSPKILLAWSKAIEGNKDILAWLSKNGFEELAVACWAIRLDDNARSWLLKNGYPQIMAFINAAEGNASALKWLEKHNLTIYVKMALAIDGDPETSISAYHWLHKNAHPSLFMLTKSIEQVKDDIEERHRDVHKFGD
jgi:hypothetical protein